MKTAFAILLLVVFGLIASFVSVFVLNLAGLPGALLAGAPGRRSKARFVLGSIVSALGQTYVYLAFTAFIVSWTLLAGKRSDVFAPLLWLFAFLVALVPIWVSLIRARAEAREQEHGNPQVQALHLTVLAALLGFLLFAFAPVVMKLAWGWVPYVE